MKNIVGAGRVVNGRITFVGFMGGFSCPVSSIPKSVKKPRKQEVDLAFPFAQRQNRTQNVAYTYNLKEAK
ncbi:hypothetical protein QO179_24910 [Bacillus stercoris]|nr:hypothetical protein [Bacillus stercoris]